MSCPECFSGSVHEGVPRGEITKLHGLDAYVSAPAEGAPAKGIIVIVPDAFGWEFVNNRLLADHYVDKGNYKVYLPDFMNGTSAPVWALDVIPKLLETGSFWSWLLKPYYLFRTLQAMLPFIIRHRPAKSWPLVETFFKSVREEEGATLPVGAAGFCWGGNHTIRLAWGESTVNGKPLIDAGFNAHPSLLKIPHDIEKIKIPTSFALPEHDPAIKAPQIEQIQKVVEAQPEERQGETKIYYDAGHGFAVRAHPDTKDKERSAAEAEDQAISWFNRWFAGVSY